MIDAATSADLARIAARERDVVNAFEPGFVPEASDVAHPSRPVPTADPLSAAAPQGTYFLTANGAGPPAFSRDGTFRIVDGELQAAGNPVLGFALGERTTLAHLRVDPYDRARTRFGGRRCSRRHLWLRSDCDRSTQR
jgi:hypothetical protein